MIPYSLRKWRWTLLLVVTILSGCGFALRGGDAVSANFATLGLDLQQANSDFSRLLRRSLEASDVRIVDAADETSSPVLQVSNETVSTRPVSVNPRARAAQYEIRLSVEISLSQNEETLIAPEILLVERSYFEDIANIAGNQEEVAIITAEMRRDLVNQLMRRLQASSEA